MTEIKFKGKEFVHSHHLSVPHRSILTDEKKSIGEVSREGNLIIQGDNLDALKALIPMYADKVDCIFIDPPYNTGNEGWTYNDKVNAPMIKEWLASNGIGEDDLLRHDKWCAMMWPRLQLLHELLAETGIIFVCIDDNEVHRLKSMLDEIFGENNFRNMVAVENDTRARSYQSLATTHEYLLIYSKTADCNYQKIFTEDKLFRYTDAIGGYDLYELRNRNSSFNSGNRPNLYYPFWVNPVASLDNDLHEISLVKISGWKKVYPQKSKGIQTVWRWGKGLAETEKNTSLFAQKSDNEYDFKIVKKYRKTDEVMNSVWTDNSISTDEGTKVLKNVFSGKKVFDYPKPLELISKVLRIGIPKDGLILDSFAGSGTTGHAVLQANKEDGGNRRFILVEMEDHIANDITAERIRRVIKGYKFTGKQKTTLYENKLTWSQFKNGAFNKDAMEEIIEKHKDDYDKVVGEIKDNTLRVYGENNITEKVEGLGGEFTFCTLGSSMEMDKILTGEVLPPYETLAPILYHMATNTTLKMSSIKENKFYIGESEKEHMWMIYKPDLDWLKSGDAALTLNFAREIAKSDETKPHRVFAPSRFVSNKLLKEEGLKVDFVPFPYALYRLYSAQKA